MRNGSLDLTIEMNRLALVIIFITSVALGLELNDPCSTPCNTKGKCVLAKDCAYALKILRKTPATYKDTLYLEQSRCGLLTGPRPFPLICCPFLLNPETCGTPQLSNRIFGGIPTKLEEHPWAALIVYDTGKRIVPKCGGSLLNSRYVLTAAHCIKNIPDKWKIHNVRFSVVNATSPENCEIVNEEEICRKEYEVKNIVVHPDYEMDAINKQHDIAIIELKDDVSFSKYIAPICLPFDEEIIEMPIIDEEFTVTGWGQTEKEIISSQQLHVDLNGKSNDVCNAVFGVANVTLTGNHLCVGGDKGRDSCKGDSGGPLLRQVTGVWYQVGIVSFGTKYCGREGFPGVYTNVVKYRHWILDIVNENHCNAS